MFTVYVGAQGTVVEGSYVTTVNDGTGGTTYTFLNTGIGAADTNRRVVAVVTWTASSSTRTVSSATIDGITATIHQNLAPSTNRGCAIISAEVPNGTSKSIVVNMSGTLGVGGSLAVSTFRLINCTASNGQATSGDTTTVNAGYGDFIVSVAYYGSASGSISWTGATEAVETNQDGSGERHSAAYHSVTAADATYDTTVAISVSGNRVMASQVFTSN